jgi:hypothetical protein
MVKQSTVSILTIAVMMAGVDETLARQAQPGPAAPKPAPRLTITDSIKRFLPRVGATVDESRSSAGLVVSNYNHPRGGKVTVVIQHKRDKNLLGFYIYNFGSVKNEKNREEIFKYLLSTNDAITIGSFFVDDEQDIGYKYLLSTEQAPNLAVFHSIYLTMATVAIERRREINKLLDSSEDR